MMNFSLAVVFILTVLPILMVMIGIAVWTDVRARELETDED